MPLQTCHIEEMGHTFAKLADWTVRGSDVVGELKACTRCGLAVIADRRGTLLIGSGGFGTIHKRIFPCQRPPACRPVAGDTRAALEELCHQLGKKHDARMHVLGLPAA